MAKKTNSALQSSLPTARVSRFHPALIGGCTTVFAQTQRQTPVGVHFRQSDLDGACGLHSVAMILSILGLCKANACEQMAVRRHGVVSRVWSAIGHSFFTGIDALDLCEALRSLDIPLKLRGRYTDDVRDVSAHNDVERLALTSLRQGSLVMISYRSLRNRHAHWLVTVGVGGLETKRVVLFDTIYALDCADDTIPLAQYNCVLTKMATAKTKRPQWRVDGRGGSFGPVVLTAAIRFEAL